MHNVAGDPDAPPILTDAGTAAALVRTLPKKIRLSQAEFAARHQVPIGTLRNWEQNRKRRDSPAFAYLKVIAREPKAVARALRHRTAA